MKRLLILLTFCFWTVLLRAQTDSLPHYELPTKPSIQQSLLPVSLITLGLISNATYINRYVQRHAYRYSGGKKRKFDDYIQYAPVLSVFALSNFGVKPKHTVKERLLVGATAYAIMGALVNGIKYTARVRRPDNSTHNSFPSGHTAMAFTGMEMLWQEYKDENLWLGISGYAIATTVGAMRLYNNRHWVGDVCVGAGIGILSTRIAYWLLPYTSNWFIKNEKSSVQMTLYPVYSNEMKGIGLTFVR